MRCARWRVFSRVKCSFLDGQRAEKKAFYWLIDLSSARTSGNQAGVLELEQIKLASIRGFGRFSA